MVNWPPASKCSNPSCADPACARVVVVNQRQVLSDRYLCDAHGEDWVTRSLDSLPIEKKPSDFVEGAVFCDIALILNRPSLIGDSQYVHLRELRGRRWLSFYCGFIEASVILSSLMVPSPPRPQTHDVLCSVVSALGGTISHALVNDCAADGKVYVAKLILTTAFGNVTVDARATDAIAAAIRSQKPILVSESLLSVP